MLHYSHFLTSDEWIAGGWFVGFFGIGVELVGDEEVVEAGLEHERGGIFL